MKHKINNKKNIIYILPLKQMEINKNKLNLELFNKFLENFFYGMKIKTLNIKDIDLQIEKKVKKKNNRYLASDILNIIKKYKPEDAYCCCGSKIFINFFNFFLNYF